MSPLPFKVLVGNQQPGDLYLVSKLLNMLLQKDFDYKTKCIPGVSKDLLFLGTFQKMGSFFESPFFVRTYLFLILICCKTLARYYRGNDR